MSPNNPTANWDQISIWYIPSVPGANTEMYFVTLLYLLQEEPSLSPGVLKRTLSTLYTRISKNNMD